VTRMANTLA